MGRAYGTPPAALLGIADPWEGLIVNTRCYLHGKRCEAESLRAAVRNGMVFPNYNVGRGA